MQALKKDKTVACSSYRRLIRIELVDMCQYIIHIRAEVIETVLPFVDKHVTYGVNNRYNSLKIVV